MAGYEVIELEGTRFLRISMADETVRTERRALSYLRGDVELRAPFPGVGEAIRCMIGHQSVIRPQFSGTGELNLRSSMGGYHIFDLEGAGWVLERGAYWASDGSVRIGIFRDPMWTSFWAGDGLINFRLHVRGEGKVALNAFGPVREIAVENHQVKVDGRLVIAWSESLRYRMRRAAASLVGHYLSGHRWMRTYEGTGKVLICGSPYWYRRILGAVAGELDETADPYLYR
jgi:uncharacterized protein (AIM24 family)